MPTCSRIDALATLLDLLRLSRQGVDPALYEIIVSDDDPSGSARAQLAGRFPDVRFIAGPRRGPGANRNHGAKQAIGEWLIFIDDDCQPSEGWLKAIAAEIDRQPIDVVEGRIVAPDKRESIFRRDVENLNGDCFWSANLAVRRALFERLGGFDEEFAQAGGEDLEFAHRLRGCARTVFSRQAVVQHPSHVLTWPQVIEFTFRIRWHALYLIKTRQTLPEAAPVWMVVPHIVQSRTLDLLRTTAARLRSGPDRVAALPRIALHWIAFPVVLPYVIFWHLRFRQGQRARIASGTGTGDSAYR